MGALDQGINTDSSFNFPQIDKYMFWNFGFGQGSVNPNNGAFDQVFYDGSTTCATLGRSDDLAVGSMQCWTGKVTETAAWTFGTFDTLAFSMATTPI